MPLCASAKIAQQSACCVCHGPPQYSRSHCSSSTLVGREIVARQARIVRCCAHPIADIKAKPYHSIFCSHLQGVPNSPVACADTSLVMATRSGIMASLKLEGCLAKEMYGNAIPAAIIPATPTRIPHVSLLSHQAAQNGTLEQVTSSLSAYHTDFSTHSASTSRGFCFMAFALPFWVEQSHLWGRGSLCNPFRLLTEYIDGAHVQL